MKKLNDIFAGILIITLLHACDEQGQETSSSKYYEPWNDLGPLFHDVQMAGIFEDSKTFVDCVPKSSPQQIAKSYEGIRKKPEFNLEVFVKENFEVPQEPQKVTVDTDRPLNDHLVSLWDGLTRSTQQSAKYSTLIELPNRYVVPGGRFREIYYWDSYFTMIGLGASGRLDLVESMLDNFAYLIDTIGFIPNGNRTYYLGRSQPPYFSSMVNTYIQHTSLEKGLKYLNAIQKEYNFWMDGAESLTPSNPEGKRVILYKGFILNRYWDQFDTPRPESYREDIELARDLPEAEQKQLYRNLRAAAESGWDFSARWFETEEFISIRTTEILPVDLNCLLYAMEIALSVLYEAQGDIDLAQHYQKKVEVRRKCINQFFWNDSTGSYQDVLWRSETHTGKITAAGVAPLYFKAATDAMAKKQARAISQHLLDDGGIVTTPTTSGQQWDAPNGWAPLQWLTVRGLEHYDEEELAQTIKHRWLQVNEKVYKNTGKMMEKYNVSDTTLLAGGGEYPTQDGFGWSNGVVLGLTNEPARY
ncbi:MAG: alpha,alpha-trehalase TreF [Cyclobacteriaceae bacterium]|nr:alpha,alpha-trehalase TreF [Cyclobacteriaceae bacterium HetDA_MAG_MS6]